MSIRSSRQQRVSESEWVFHLVDRILPHNVLVYIINIINNTILNEATTSSQFRNYKYIDSMHQKWVAYLHL